LNSLLEHANVHIISYVNTRVRQMAVEKDATTLPTPAGQGWAQEEKLTGAAGWVRMQFLMIAMRSSRSATAMGSWHLQFAPTRPSTQHSNTPGAAGGNLFWLWKRPLGPLGAEELWKRLPKRLAMKHEKKCPGNRHQTVLQRT